MSLNPIICGRWDGASIWLQWDAAPVVTAETAYRVQIRWRDGAEWGEWKEIGHPTRRLWRVVPTVRQGGEAQARVGLTQGKPEQEAPTWHPATECLFLRARAPFRFTLQASAAPLILEEGTVVSSYLDGAGCSYRLTQELLLQPGAQLDREMEALHLSGWCQIDEPGDFVARPAFGLTVTNLAPSVNDIELTGRDFTRVEPLKHPGGPGQLVKTGRRWCVQ